MSHEYIFVWMFDEKKKQSEKCITHQIFQLFFVPELTFLQNIYFPYPLETYSFVF